MNQMLSVHLRVFRGEKLSYNADGTAQTENFIVKLQYDTSEYTSFLKMLVPNGYVKVDIERVLDLNKKDASRKYGYEEVEDKSKFQEEVKNAMAKFLEVPETHEQKIASMAKEMAELREMLKNSIKENVVPEVVPEVDADLAAARTEYFALVGKQGNANWNVETIKQKIAELKLKS